MFNRNVGAPIDQQKGLRWKKKFASVKPTNAATDYFLKASTLKETLNTNNCVGISLFYAIDAAGKLMIVPMGIDANGKAIATQSISLEPSIDWQTAWTCINRYDGKVKAHFFGTETYNRLLVGEAASLIRISLALNDEGAPQLLLSNASVANPTAYEDMSTPCPPICSSN
jgi:hypothetical protein